MAQSDRTRKQKERERKKGAVAKEGTDPNRKILPWERRRDYVLQKFMENPPFQTPQELAECIAYYIEYCDSRGKSYTWTGMAFHLGFSSTNALQNYVNHEEFGHIMQRAKLLIETQRNEQLVGEGKEKAAGLIFDLVNQHGWRQKSKEEQQDEAESNAKALNVTVLPHTPNSIEEWEEMYQRHMEKKREEKEAIDVSPSGQDQNNPAIEKQPDSSDPGHSEE